MGADELKSALRNANEVELTVTGRKSGDESSRPIWFVIEGDNLLLLPVGGTDSNWYRNVQKTPAIGLTADGAELRADAEPTEDPATVEHVAGVFGEKYGADKLKEYYPNLNAAVEVPLT
ncbi:MAG: nitroreductase/quinone reductase family protein [Solirubrobacterales bacterium]